MVGLSNVMRPMRRPFQSCGVQVNARTAGRESSHSRDCKVDRLEIALSRNRFGQSERIPC